MSGAEGFKSNVERADNFFDYCLSSDIFALDGLLDHSFVRLPILSVIVFASLIMAMFSQIGCSDPSLLANELEQAKEVSLIELTIITFLHLGQFGFLKLICNAFWFRTTPVIPQNCS